MWGEMTITVITVTIATTMTIEAIMKLKLLFLLISGALLTNIAGCTVSGPSVKVRPPISIEGGGGGPGHCPPGQAKKGRC